MKTLLSLLCIICACCLNAQITVDTTFSSGWKLEMASTTSSGQLFFAVSPYPQDSLVIYNSDWSVRRQVVLPTGYTYADFNTFNGYLIASLSDKLFNSSDTLVFLAEIFLNEGAGTGFLAVINEYGHVVFTFPDTVYLGGYFDLFEIGNNFKLYYQLANALSQTSASKLYSLPGTLPCNQCSITNGINEPTGGPGNAGLLAYPNPFSNTVTVKYNLPQGQNGRIALSSVEGQEIKSITLNNASDNLTIGTTDLPRGLIIISLYGNNQHLISKKLVKIE